jgi:hypothetical protein
MTNAISSNTKRKVKYPESTHWSEINWRKVERKVYKLQKRIYKATQEGNHRTAKSLQKTLLNSWSAKALAVKKVTQENGRSRWNKTTNSEPTPKTGQRTQIKK